MSDFKEIYDLIKRGEDQQLDFKQHISNPQKIAKTIVAFTNTDGGKIVIGIDDRGEITGVDVDQEKYMMIKAGRRFCDPQVFIHFSTLSFRKTHVLVADIKQNKLARHYALSESGIWQHYVRVEDQTILVPEIDDQADADKYNLQPIPIIIEQNDSLISYLEENGAISIKEYMKIMNISYKIAKRSLDHLVDSAVLDIEYINNIPYYFKVDEGRF